jgi:hypothetical protein
MDENDSMNQSRRSAMKAISAGIVGTTAFSGLATAQSTPSGNSIPAAEEANQVLRPDTSELNGLNDAAVLIFDDGTVSAAAAGTVETTGQSYRIEVSNVSTPDQAQANISEIGQPNHSEDPENSEIETDNPNEPVDTGYESTGVSDELEPTPNGSSPLSSQMADPSEFNGFRFLSEHPDDSDSGNDYTNDYELSVFAINDPTCGTLSPYAQLEHAHEWSASGGSVDSWSGERCNNYRYFDVIGFGEAGSGSDWTRNYADFERDALGVPNWKSYHRTYCRFDSDGSGYWSAEVTTQGYERGEYKCDFTADLGYRADYDLNCSLF